MLQFSHFAQEEHIPSHTHVVNDGFPPKFQILNRTLPPVIFSDHEDDSGMQLDDLFREEAGDVDDGSVNDGYGRQARQRVSSTNCMDCRDPGPMPAAGPDPPCLSERAVNSDPRCRSMAPTGRQEVVTPVHI